MFNYSKPTSLKLAVLLATSVLATQSLYAKTSRVSNENASIESMQNLQSLKQNTVNQVSKLHIEKFVTSTGTPVFFVEANELPIVDISMNFNAGSARDELISKNFNKDLQGVASLTASTLKTGIMPNSTLSKTALSEDQIAEIAEDNAFGFYINASKDVFSVSLRSLSAPDYLSKGIKLFNSTLVKSSFPEESLIRIKNQRKLGLTAAEKNPNYIASRAFAKALYGSHPYARQSSGTIETLPNIEREHLQAFKDKFLVAKNASIAITGNLSLEEAKKLAEGITKGLAVGSRAKDLPNPQPIKAQRIHIPFDSSQTTIIVGQLGVDLRNKTEFELGIANDVFGGSSFQARLMTELRKKRGLTYGAYSSFNSMQAQGSFSIMLSTRNEQADTALNVLKSTLDDYVKNGASQEEIDETKMSVINQFPLSMATNDSVNSKLAMMAFLDLPLDYINNYTTNVSKVTKDASHKAFTDIINPKNMIIVTVGKKQEK